jgi:hypothetical protein
MATGETMSSISNAGPGSADGTAQAAAQRQFPCRQCGAALSFAPGTSSLTCQYCGAINQIAAPTEVVQELDFRAQLQALDRNEAGQEVLAVKCNGCGAESQLPPGIAADSCPFCGVPIVASAMSKRQIKPRSLLPFYITKQQAGEAFSKWIKSLWFAPSALSKAASTGRLSGIYIPAWTYDSDTISDYTGARGDNYTVTETYSTVENGRHVTRTRTVTKIRWTSVHGRVRSHFDDVLVLASDSLPRKQAERLEPWDLKNLVPYADDYLAGFVCETYRIDLPTGFEQARVMMDPVIRQTINRDIGGDHQRIDSVSTAYYNVSFKHLLLPIWLSAYRYLQATYRFLVNARTGEVQGERPYSFWKIFFFVLMCVAVAAILILLFARMR